MSNGNVFDSDRIMKIHKEQEEKEKIKRVSEAVRYHRDKLELEKIQEGKEFASSMLDMDFETDYSDLAEQASRDLLQRQDSISFLYKELDDFVQLGPGSLAIIAAPPGTGKSTICANLAASLKQQEKRVLIISNEEREQDIGIRISCLELNVSIHKYKSKFGLHENTYKEVIDNVSRFNKKYLTIRGLSFKNNPQYVTTAEGICALLLAAKDLFDVVIIDYYQNINMSTKYHNIQPHEANEIFAKEIDKIKNVIGFPIILLAQIRKGDEDYKTRIEGRKLIVNKCTDFFELQIDKANNRSVLICRKDRWLGNQGEERFLGYSHGRYVPYTKEFEDDVIKNKEIHIDKFTADSLEKVDVEKSKDV